MITLINPLLVDEIWPTIWPILKPAVDRCVFEIDNEESVKEDIKQEYRYLLVATIDGKLKGCFVVGFRQGGIRVLELQYVGGTELKKWQEDAEKALDVIAKKENCVKIIAFGRDGWKKMSLDYKKNDTVYYVKEIV